MNEMTAAEAANRIYTLLANADYKKQDMGLPLASITEYFSDALEFATVYLRKIASGELVKAPIRCIDCEHSLPMDMKKYPDLTCHLCGGNLRVRVNMSCPCAKRPGKDDRHEANL